MLILDLTRLLPGPLAGRMLAEIGYQVLRVLPPSGDLMAAASPEGYAWLNDLKTSETVDLKSEAGRARLRELAQAAVALLETNRPGVMERLGVGPDELRALNPALTYVRLAGYREQAFREQPGHDLAYLAAAGLLERFDPAWQTLQLADTSGAWWAVIATIEGIRRGGGFFEVYMAETARPFAYPRLSGLDGQTLCYSVYPTAQGQIALAALEPHLWLQFCQAVKHPEWQTEAFTQADSRNPIWNELVELFGTQSAAEWEVWAADNRLPLRAVQAHQTPTSLLPWREQH